MSSRASNASARTRARAPPPPRTGAAPWAPGRRSSATAGMPRGPSPRGMRRRRQRRGGRGRGRIAPLQNDPGGGSFREGVFAEADLGFGNLTQRKGTRRVEAENPFPAFSGELQKGVLFLELETDRENFVFPRPQKTRKSRLRPVGRLDFQWGWNPGAAGRSIGEKPRVFHRVHRSTGDGARGYESGVQGVPDRVSALARPDSPTVTFCPTGARGPDRVG